MHSVIMMLHSLHKITNVSQERGELDVVLSGPGPVYSVWGQYVIIKLLLEKNKLTFLTENHIISRLYAYWLGADTISPHSHEAIYMLA